MQTRKRVNRKQEVVSASKHVRHQNYWKDKFNYIKANVSRAKVYTNTNGQFDNHCPSYLYVFPNGMHAIINTEGNVVSIVPFSLLKRKKEAYVRCNCSFCKTLKPKSIAHHTKNT